VLLSKIATYTQRSFTQREKPLSDNIDSRGLRTALGSPLRLLLVAELLDSGDAGVSRDRAIGRTGRHEQDVVACMRPLLNWGLVEWLEDEDRYRIPISANKQHIRVLSDVVEERRDFIDRERRVRDNVLGGMIGVDPKMLMVFEMIRQVSRLDVSVLVTGETGTGKELVARAVHELSARRKGFFGAVNCATLSDELFASEMFGHVKGAFTGAVKDHAGLFERCNKGTLFLDEVGDLSVPNQVKLLRVLQDSTFTRVGEVTPRTSNFRIICATNRDLVTMVQQMRFREDLYYRLNVFPLRVPSLRERPADLAHLANELLAGKLRKLSEGEESPALTERAVHALSAHSWPGNVRELENVLTRALIMAGDGPIDAHHLPRLTGAFAELARTDEVTPMGFADTGTHPPMPMGFADTGSHGVVAPPLGAAQPQGNPHVDMQTGALKSMADVEREHIAFVLSAQSGNISASASTLGMSRTTLYKKMRDYGLSG